MKIKKIISGSLVVGLLFNTTLSSFAGTLSEDTRYETLEGEYITIDDSTEGELVEIEVFGNTVQDENNLEDIQSVGDLYVDENGNPILDNQGREQYKIDITSSNYNSNKLLYKDYNIPKSTTIDVNIYRETSYTLEFVVSDSLSDGVIITTDIDSFAINVQKSGENIIIENFNTDVGFVSCSLEVSSGDIISIVYDKVDYTIYKNGEKIKTLSWINGRISEIIIEQPLDFLKINNINIPEKDCMTTPPLENKTTILLPTQLQKVGDVADRLYWDNKRGRYVIEKNIDSIILNGSENWNVFYIQTVYDDMNPFLLRDDNLFSRFPFGYTKAISNIARNEEPHNWRNTDRWFKYTEYEGVKCVGINLEPSLTDVEYCNAESFKNFLSKNNMIIHLPLSSPNLIDTNIMSKLKIPTYDGKTYIFVDSENGISPTLKVIVDRIINRAKEAIETAKTNPTMENISLARMWTNLIKESTIKDGLQNEIDEITEVVDLTIEKKTATANLDLYIKSNNSLTMSLSTNSVTFENYSGVEDLEMLDAVNITINSSLPYSLNAYMPTPISNADGSNTMDANILNIRDNSESNYSQFINTTNKVVLKDDCETGNNNIHNIDLKLSGNNLHEADVYKTVIKFEATQK